MALAEQQQKPLDFRIAMFTGGVMVTGFVAPWWAMYDVTLNSARQQVDAAFKRTKDERERVRQVDHYIGPLETAFLAARQGEAGNAHDEVTLYDASVFPAGTAQSGGLALPVVRLPIASINAWWVMEGKPISGTPSFGIGLGFLIPVGN